jgi:hypothetical protein
MRVLMLILVLCAAGCSTARKDLAPVAVPTAATKVAAPPAVPAAAKNVVVLDDFDGELAWALEAGWGDPAAVTAMAWKGQPKNRALDIGFKLAEKKKIVVSRALRPAVDFSKHNAVLADINSKLPVPVMMAVGLGTGSGYVESAPVMVKAGANKDVMFRLDAATFKSAATVWEYRGKAGDLSKVGKIYLLLYPIPDGRVQIENLRLATVE